MKSTVKDAFVKNDVTDSPAKTQRPEEPSTEHSISRILPQTLIAWVERLMGLPIMGSVSEAIAKVGLRGLGINVHYDLDRSGERWLLRALAARLPAWICFDIGANVGDYTCALLEAGAGRVISFEPGPEAFHRLRDRFAGKEIAVEVVNVALGERTGQSPFFVSLDPRHSALNSRDGSITALASSAFQSVSVPLTTIDAYIADSGIEPDFIKIDVEGFELEVFEGMRATLSRRPPKIIQFEFNTHHLKRRQNLGDFADVLTNYALYRLSSGSLRPLDPSHYLSTVYAYSNVVGVHSSFRDSGPGRSFLNLRSKGFHRLGGTLASRGA